MTKTLILLDGSTIFQLETKKHLWTITRLIKSSWGKIKAPKNVSMIAIGRIGFIHIKK